MRWALDHAREFMTHEGLLHRVARGTAIVVTLQVAGIGLTYLAQVLLARVLGAHEYGIYRYVFSWVTLLGMLATLGFPGALQRFVPEHRQRGEFGLLRGLLRGTRQLTCLTSIVLAVIAAAVFHWSSGRWLEPEMALPLVFFCWMIPVMTFLQVNTHIARSMHRMVAAFLPYNVGRPAAALVAAAVLPLFRKHVVSTEWSSFDILLLIGGLLFAMTLFQWSYVRRAYPEECLTAELRSNWGEWLRVALPLLLVTGFGILLSQLGVLMVGAMLTPADVAIFSAAAQVALLVSFLLGSVNSVVAPRISELFHAGRKRELQRMLTMVLHVILWPSLALSLALLAAARPVMTLFGEEFADSTGPIVLTILILGQLVNAASGSVGLIMNVTGHQNTSAAVYGGAAIANVLLNLLLIPRYGITGAAAAMSGTMVLWNVLLVWIVARRLELYPSAFTLWVIRGREEE